MADDLSAPLGQGRKRKRSKFPVPLPLVVAGVLGFCVAVFLVWAAVALPCYVLFQVIPMPAVLVRILSPARGELLRGLEPLYGYQTFGSLSVAPSSTFTHFLSKSVSSGSCA